MAKAELTQSQRRRIVRDALEDGHTISVEGVRYFMDEECDRVYQICVRQTDDGEHDYPVAFCETFAHFNKWVRDMPVGEIFSVMVQKHAK